jgi:hypothetical protein
VERDRPRLTSSTTARCLSQSICCFTAFSSMPKLSHFEHELCVRKFIMAGTA